MHAAKSKVPVCPLHINMLCGCTQMPHFFLFLQQTTIWAPNLPGRASIHPPAVQGAVLVVGELRPRIRQLLPEPQRLGTMLQKYRMHRIV